MRARTDAHRTSAASGSKVADRAAIATEWADTVTRHIAKRTRCSMADGQAAPATELADAVKRSVAKPARGSMVDGRATSAAEVS
jgi:hypothetical protein